MTSMLQQWRRSRWLDDGRGAPLSRGISASEAQRLREVDAALRQSAPLETPSPYLRTRILAKLEAPRRPAAALPRWLPIGMAAACTLAVVGAILLSRLGSGPAAAPPSPGPGPNVAQAPAHESITPGILLDGLRRRQEQAAKAIDDPIRREAALILADTRRMADLVLSRLPLEHVSRLTQP
jgi:hypothetical protein